MQRTLEAGCIGRMSPILVSASLVLRVTSFVCVNSIRNMGNAFLHYFTYNVAAMFLSLLLLIFSVAVFFNLSIDTVAFQTSSVCMFESVFFECRNR